MAEKGATPDLEQPSKQNVDECHNEDETCCQIDPLTFEIAEEQRIISLN
jgi:hypothetical protein